MNEKLANLKIEIADTDLKRALGLMYRDSLPEDSGMMFVFPESTPASFWMKDTHIPLSVAYINEDGMIINIEDMEPLSLNSVTSRGPCKYALEVNKGWFEKNGIHAGDKIL
mgnify:CR=1 FL=1